MKNRQELLEIRRQEMRAKIEEAGTDMAKISRKADINPGTLFNFLTAGKGIVLSTFDLVMNALNELIAEG